MKSCIYTGVVRHSRLSPVAHEFRYRIFMMYLRLDEIPRVFDAYRFWSAEQFNLASFRRRDHFGDPERDLEDCVRKAVATALGGEPAGPIDLLTHLRYFGYCMNPVSFYYCWDASETALEAIVAEVHNTPWGETHCYVLDPQTQGGQRFTKAFHVSPFMGMDQEYHWRLGSPGETLSVHMKNYQRQECCFNASMAMRRQPISSGNLASVLTGYPFMTGKVVAAIYWQAIRLKLKGIPFHPHPGHRKSGNLEMKRDVPSN